MLGGSLAGCGRTAPHRSLEEVPEKPAADGTTIVVGDPSAAVVVRLHEDPRCPVCEEFETSGAGPEPRDATVLRDAVTEYTLASFLDDLRLRGQGA